MNNSPQEINPQLNKRNSRKIIWIAVGIFILLAAGFFVAQYFSPKQAPITLSPQAKEYTPTLENYKTYLLGKSHLLFPKEVSANKISESLLPQELKIFIIEGLNITNINFEELAYENGGQGFRISYEVSNQDFLGLYTLFGNLAFQNKWEIIRGERTNLYALIELTNNKYNVRISQAQENENRITIIIEIL